MRKIQSNKQKIVVLHYLFFKFAKPTSRCTQASVQRGKRISKPLHIHQLPGITDGARRWKILINTTSV
jgi:hypothetical protein